MKSIKQKMTKLINVFILKSYIWVILITSMTITSRYTKAYAEWNVTSNIYNHEDNRGISFILLVRA